MTGNSGRRSHAYWAMQTAQALTVYMPWPCIWMKSIMKSHRLYIPVDAMLGEHGRQSSKAICWAQNPPSHLDLNRAWQLGELAERKPDFPFVHHVAHKAPSSSETQPWSRTCSILVLSPGIFHSPHISISFVCLMCIDDGTGQSIFCLSALLCVSGRRCYYPRVPRTARRPASSHFYHRHFTSLPLMWLDTGRWSKEHNSVCK